MKRLLTCSVGTIVAFMAIGCGGGANEPKLKAVEPPDSPVKTSEPPKGDHGKGSSGGMSKNPGANS